MKGSVKRFLCFFTVMLVIVGSLRAEALSVSAVAAAVIAGDTGEVIFAENENNRLPMASTTKIMTALLLCEYGELEREITVTEQMVKVEGSSMGLLPGDTVSLRALLYGLLLASGNDAANTVAYTVGGSPEGFAELMNLRAAELGLENTHFVTPSGLDAEQHYTTALELARLTREAMKNPDFAAAAATEYETVYYGNPPYRRQLKNHNRLLGEVEGAVGVKTGYTKKSGRCLVSAVRRDGKYVIAVTLNAPDDWNDHRLLLEYGLSKLHLYKPDIGELPQLSCVNGEVSALPLEAETAELSVLDENSITYKLYLPELVYAPVSKGEQLGRLEYYCSGRLIASAPIYCAAVARSCGNNFFMRLKAILISMLINF